MARWGIVLLVLAVIPGTLRAEDPAAPASAPAEVSEAEKVALDRISADSLRGHLSFLASDLLEGRGTPSRGLDIAAEYIAAQFRRGLEPIKDQSYFQTADWKYLAPDPSSFVCEMKQGSETIRIGGDRASGFFAKALDLSAAPTFKIVATDTEALKKLTPEALAGKVVLAEVPHPNKVSSARMLEANRARIAFLSRMNELKPLLIVDVERDAEGAAGLRRDLQGRRAERPPGSPDLVRLHSPELAEEFNRLPAGPTEATLTLRVGEPTERTAKVRNVLGVLRGSDPELKETYVILSAHYDHLGIGPQNGSGDRIFNGANDDGSGTVSVIEIASALATLTPHPKRSIIFAAFYGEEHGLVGSQYYTDHPLIPLDKTVAAINLEQLGRTDDSEGPRVSAATVTGYSFSDVGPILHLAGASIGVDVSEHPTKSDLYFQYSDNASLARAGIPAHTISVAFAFPDYHGADDEWEKVDYANMVKVDRMAALGLLEIADGPAPSWNKNNPKAAPFLRKASTSR